MAAEPNAQALQVRALVRAVDKRFYADNMPLRLRSSERLRRLQMVRTDGADIGGVVEFQLGASELTVASTSVLSSAAARQALHVICSQQPSVGYIAAASLIYEVGKLVIKQAMRVN